MICRDTDNMRTFVICGGVCAKSRGNRENMFAICRRSDIIRAFAFCGIGNTTYHEHSQYVAIPTYYELPHKVGVMQLINYKEYITPGRVYQGGEGGCHVNWRVFLKSRF